MLTRDTVPGVDVNLGYIIPIAVGLAGILLVLGRLGLKAQKLKPVTGVEGMIGVEGRARDPLEPGGSGYVDVRGELWRALAHAAIPAGGPVRVVGVNGLTLIVEPSRASAREGESS
jgi:membrane-bound serine protease (ClpP class)